METLIGIAIALLVILIIMVGVGVYLILGSQPAEQVFTPPPVHVDLEPLERRIRDVPNRVLQSIQGSVNTHKGALGELIGYLELRGKYDRIIPLGNIVDFICIRFPTDTDEGTLDFIDVKTGGASRLSKDQRSLQGLIHDKKIGFVKLKVTDERIAGDED